MYSETSFRAELTRIWSTVMSFKPRWYKVTSQKVEIDDAWQMYLNARNSNLAELLLGDVKLRSQIEVLKNFGTTSGTETTMERQTLFDDKNAKIFPAQVNATVMAAKGQGYRRDDGIAHIRRGSVLNDGWWWPFKNDAWVIGGIHGLKRFHLTLAKVPDDLLWDAGDARPRVLGRELLGLAAGGYALIGLPSWAIQSPTRSEIKTAPEPSKVAVTNTPVAAQHVREMIGHVFAPQNRQGAQGLTFGNYYAALGKVTSIADIKDGILSKEVDFDSYDFSKV